MNNVNTNTPGCQKPSEGRVYPRGHGYCG